MKQPYVAPLSTTDGDLTIRMYRLEDAAVLAEGTNASYEHLRPWMLWATDSMTETDADALIRRFIAGYFAGTEFTMGIWREDHFLGGTGFHLRGRSLDASVGEIGMWIRQDCAGQGLGQQALRLMLKWGFEEWGWERIFWQCDARNAASARVALNCGLLYEGTFRSDDLTVDGNRRDTQYYAMLKSEYSR